MKTLIESRSQAYKRITEELKAHIEQLKTQGPDLLTKVEECLSDPNVSPHEREQLEAAKELAELLTPR